MDLKEVRSLIQFVSKLEVHEVDLKLGEVRICIKNKGDHPATQEQGVPFQPRPVSGLTAEPPKEEESTESKYVAIKSPMVGTFYRRPAPDKDPYVKVGDQVEENTKVCTIEAMKLFNEVEAEVSGKIIKILIEDASPVEYGQDLFWVDPS